MTAATKAQAEERQYEIIEEKAPELVCWRIHAEVLSNDLCKSCQAAPSVSCNCPASRPPEALLPGA